MILVIDAVNRHRFGSIIADMYQLRARVFRDRLGWDVTVQNGRESDLFDDLDPAYLIALDDEYNVVGCNRMLQTTGPHMLADVFQDILCGEPPLRSATVWENTRFCVDTERLKRPEVSQTVSTATCELMVGILEYGRDSGISDVISVIDPLMNRVLKRSNNAPYDYIGKTVQMGKTRAMAALNDCTDERIQNVRDFAGITGDVFADEDAVVDALEARKANIAVAPELRAYCHDQIAAAETEDERQAALALQDKITQMFRSSGPARPETHPR